MARKPYQPTPPEEIPAVEDDWLDFIHYAAKQAFIAKVEVAALKRVIADQGMTIDPKDLAEARLREQENEIDRLKVEEPTVAGLIQDLIYSGSSNIA